MWLWLLLLKVSCFKSSVQPTFTESFLVSGVNIYIITPFVCLVCIFYTCIGGLKAVIWTDVIQGLVMMGSLTIVAIQATITVGGFETLIERNLNSSRLELPS